MEEMTHSSSDARYVTGLNQTSGGNESHSSGVSWAAVIGGAFVTAALSLILLALGTGLGFSSVSRGRTWARPPRRSARQPLYG